ncbi:MAG TPA: peptide deformylase [Chitinivibrionales bacterium]|nr:peptide deformylase [Chitinivibrionales bacterium]
MLEILLYGDPILRKKAKPVAVFDAKLRAFLDEMIETMKERDGVGLAAPQVGDSRRIVVIDATKGEAPAMVLVNPEFTFKSKELEEREEGCLSFPDIHLDIKRPAVVSVKAFDENGKEILIEKADGLLCRALQHEIDHCDGLLIIDQVSLLQRKLLSSKLKKISAAGPGRPAPSRRAKAV